MRIPARLRRQAGRHALVDGIPFTLPVDSSDTPAILAMFTIDADRAAPLLPGDEVHPMRLTRRRGLLVVTVVNYEVTDIGRYIEFSLAIACTHGPRPAPPLLPALLRGRYGTGQYVVDLPVSSEVSVKGGKGIWGMPKHQASLDFHVERRTVSSQYDLDDSLAVRVEVDRPRFARLPLSASAVNYSAFRGLLYRSFIHFRGRGGLNVPLTGSARVIVGDHPRVQWLNRLGMSSRPLASLWLPRTAGILDDHFECWFLSYAEPPTTPPEGLESVVDLGLGEGWLPAPPDDQSNVSVRTTSPSSST